MKSKKVWGSRKKLICTTSFRILENPQRLVITGVPGHSLLDCFRKQDIGHIETGAVKMSLSALVSIANALDVTPDVLLGGEAYHTTEVLRGEFAELFRGCDARALRLMFELCETVKADAARRQKERIH